MRLLNVIAAAAFVSGLIALPCSAYRFRRRPVWSVLLFAIPAFVFLGTCDVGQRIMQAKTLDQLDALDSNYQMLINGAPARNPAQVLSALKGLQWLPKHHSNPTTRINIEITDKMQHVVLWVDRDSGNPREYWVFNPTAYITRYNEIGNIVTSAFDNR